MCSCHYRFYWIEFWTFCHNDDDDEEYFEFKSVWKSRPRKQRTVKVLTEEMCLHEQQLKQLMVIWQSIRMMDWLPNVTQVMPVKLHASGSQRRKNVFDKKKVRGYNCNNSLSLLILDYRLYFASRCSTGDKRFEKIAFLYTNFGDRQTNRRTNRWTASMHKAPSLALEIQCNIVLH